jgi:predicted metalloprotease with PDZ domain
MNSVPVGSPAYDAGVERDDVISSVDGESVSRPEQFDAIVRRHKPGTALQITYARRGRAPASGVLRLIQNPQMEIVPAESEASLTPAQRQFREQWLGSRRRAF